MGKIRIENIRVYANHGCLREEGLIGSDYLVTIEVLANLREAALSDKLADTVDYVHINHIVKEEMEIKSKLLEHVGNRIIDRVFRELDAVDEISITVSKVNPPIGGDVEMVTIELNKKRS
ncbi:dihydroneopterin aldolase [Eudoraea chungangensis]|uniref:dihydroneopterin aldolase n=1 Tax=Eudoraea chungangensis TaxID=1481905 RepID=UPI0023EDEB94|nr:dihydroneopterin aldolase [Eudoraea chungangensis]